MLNTEIKYLRLSNRLALTIRRNPGYRDWRKRDIIKNYCVSHKIPQPLKKNHAENWNILCRFAVEHKIPTPQSNKVSTKQYKPKPNLTYDGTNGFTQWRKLRYEALKRSGGHCECCSHTAKTSGSPLHVDHIKPKSLYPKLEFVLENLQVLCIDCNIGKGNWDETNWREINAEREVEEQLDREHLSNVVHSMNRSYQIWKGR